MRAELVLAAALLALALGAEAAWTWVPCPVQTRALVNGGSTRSSSGTALISPAGARRRGVPVPTFDDDGDEDADGAEALFARGGGRSRRDLYTSLTSKCASVEVPLDHAAPSGPSTRVFAKCYVSASSTAQLWMLQGGPGFSSWPLETYMANVVALTGTEFDVCTTDFRGVDRSSLYTCQATQAFQVGSEDGCELADAEQGPCADEINAESDPTVYSTTQAAHDVAYLVNNYPKSTTKTVIYAASYGTFWLTRIMELYPALANGWILDSVVNAAPNNPFNFANFDKQFDEVMRTKVLAGCASDAFCSGKVTSNPTTFAQQAFQKAFEQGGCPGITSGDGLVPNAATLNLLLYTLSTTTYTRPIIPAVLYRLNRCNSDDVTIINWLVYSLIKPVSTVNFCDTSSNDVIYNQIIAAELFNATASLASVTQGYSSLTFNPRGAESLYWMRRNWTTAVDTSVFDEFANIANVTAPVLILNGDLDTQTPLSYAASLSSYLQTLGLPKVTLGTGVGQGHVVAQAVGTNSPVCGFRIITDFAKAPTSTISLSCLASLDAPSWQGNASYNQFYLNTTDLYEGRPSGAPLSATPFIIALIVVAVIAAGLLVTVIIMGVQMAFAAGHKPASAAIPMT